MEEDVIVNKVVNIVSVTIDDKVEYSISAKMNSLTKWVAGSMIAALAIIIVFIVASASSQSRIEQQVLSIKETQEKFIVEVKGTNKDFFRGLNSVNNDVNTVQSDIFVITNNMERIDPTFISPYKTRGYSKEKTN